MDGPLNHGGVIPLTMQNFTHPLNSKFVMMIIPLLVAIFIKKPQAQVFFDSSDA